MNRNLHIAAAVAAILGSGTALAAASNPPTLAQAAAAPVQLYVAGSSAAAAGVIADLEVNLCGGVSNALVATGSPNANFQAVSCAPPSGTAGADGNTYYTIYYRSEGGSVTGALPIVNNVQVNELDLSLTSLISCTNNGTPTYTAGVENVCTATISGVSTGNGTDDSFSGAVSKGNVQMGILDVEPSALVGNNYPSAYQTSAWGPNNQAGVQSLGSSQLFGEVYGIFVNENSTAFTENPLQLSTQMVANILSHKIKNWSLVTDINGSPVTNAGLAITIVNREAGSGSRAATDLLIQGDTCQPGAAALADPSGVDYFATGDVLSAANSVPGAITYATIDKSGSNLTLVALNGVTPSNLAAASGAYPFWVEASTTVNPNAPATGNAASLLSFLTTSLQTIGTAPHAKDILAINGITGVTNTAHTNVAANGSTATGSLAGLGSATIYTNPFTRAGVTCNVPVDIAKAQ